MKVGIVIDAWKRPIFARHLSAAGYTYTQAGGLSPGTLLLIVNTENRVALEVVVRAANEEAKRTTSP